jgi:methionine aminotransferase
MIESKLPGVGTTIFTTMSQLANEYGAINLGQGFPDFAMDEALVEGVSKAMRDGMNQYTHMFGHPLLRKNIAEKLHNLYSCELHPDEHITITPGATYGIYTALTTILQPGDEVIVLEPAYDSYIPNIVINGATPVCIRMEPPNYATPIQDIQAALNSKTKAIIINSPHNPTGSIVQEADWLALQEILEPFPQVHIISDEVYEHLIFDGYAHQSVLKFPELAKKAFVVFSFGKTYHCTGWKLGYCIAPTHLMKEFKKVHQFNAFCCDTPKQVALADYILHTEAYTELGKDMQRRRDHLAKGLELLPWKPIASHGSYFQCFAIGNSVSDKVFAEQLVKEAGVATIPVSAFYNKGDDFGIIRLCFAKKIETLDAAIERLVRWNQIKY